MKNDQPKYRKVLDEKFYLKDAKIAIGLIEDGIYPVESLLEIYNKAHRHIMACDEIRAAVVNQLKKNDTGCNAG